MFRKERGTAPPHSPPPQARGKEEAGERPKAPLPQRGSLPAEVSGAAYPLSAVSLAISLSSFLPHLCLTHTHTALKSVTDIYVKTQAQRKGLDFSSFIVFCSLKPDSQVAQAGLSTHRKSPASASHMLGRQV